MPVSAAVVGILLVVLAASVSETSAYCEGGSNLFVEVTGTNTVSPTSDVVVSETVTISFAIEGDTCPPGQIETVTCIKPLNSAVCTLASGDTATFDCPADSACTLTYGLNQYVRAFASAGAYAGLLYQ